jgi:predicted nuclease of predicted toxin-antitoxin system
VIMRLLLTAADPSLAARVLVCLPQQTNEALHEKDLANREARDAEQTVEELASDVAQLQLAMKGKEVIQPNTCD